MNRLATCSASNLAGADKCIRIIPAGVFRAIDGRPVGIGGWILNATNAASIIKLAAARSDDFVIDYEHQTMQAAKNGQPAPAAGWFKRLEWREGKGLFATDVRWTERAAAMIKAREYRYVSPVFGFDSKTGMLQFLQSAAITNYAALDGLADIAAAKGQPVASPVAAAADKDGVEHCKLVCDAAFGDQTKPTVKSKSTAASGVYGADFIQVGASRIYGKTLF